jgi:beta-adrenergic-receptor kinase
MTGGDLSYHLSQKGCFPRTECHYYSARIMLGLQALHDRGYVYRDLKPENCLLGEDGRVKLTDLGLAVKVTPDLHGAAGTRGYWAPEMIDRDNSGKRKNYDRMVDWFSFGCCLAEFISGTSPFRSQKALDFGLEKGHSTKVGAFHLVILDYPNSFLARILTHTQWLFLLFTLATISRKRPLIVPQRK